MHSRSSSEVLWKIKKKVFSQLKNKNTMKLYSHSEYLKFGSRFGFGRKHNRSRFGVPFELSGTDRNVWVLQILNHYSVDGTHYAYPRDIRRVLRNAFTNPRSRNYLAVGSGFHGVSVQQINDVISNLARNIDEFFDHLGIRYDSWITATLSDVEDEDEDEEMAAAPPAPPAPEVVDTTLPPLTLVELTDVNDSLQAMDYIEGVEVSIRDHLQADPDNISIIWKSGTNYFAANVTKDDITSRNKNRVVYECGPSIPDNSLYTPASGIVRHALLNLRTVGVMSGGFAYLNQPYDGEVTRVYFLNRVGSVARVVAHNMVFGDEHGVINAVGALHCQPGNGGDVYELRPARIQTTPASAYGRRRKNKK